MQSVSSFIEFVFLSSLWSLVFIGLFVYEEKDPSRKLNLYSVLILGLLFKALLEIYFRFLYFVGLTSSFLLEEHIHKYCKNWVFFWMLNVLILWISDSDNKHLCNLQINFFLPSDPIVKLTLCTIQIQADYNRNHYSKSRVVPAFQWHLT